MAGRPFSHLLITRPLPEAMDLTARLAPLLQSAGVTPLLQPAQIFTRIELGRERQADLRHLLEDSVDRGSGRGANRAANPAILIFNSPRSVEFGLDQIPPECLKAAALAAMGPATARALNQAGHVVDIAAASPHDSEAMMAALARHFGAPAPGGAAVAIVTAAGGRQDLRQWLTDQGNRVLMLFVYARGPAELDESVTREILASSRVLSVWTSGEAMNALSRQLAPGAWFKLCQGEWLVVSQRLQRLARAFRPAAIHLSAGPANAELATAVRKLL